MFFISVSVSAQPPKYALVLGNVYSAQDSTDLQGATVVFTEVGLGGVSCRDKGLFLLPKVPYGTYLLKVSFLGFETKHISLKADHDTVNMGVIYLHPDTKILK